MEILKIVILGLVPMITILVAVAAFLMSDRKQLTGLINSWRARFKEQSELNKALKAAQTKIKKDHEAKLKQLKSLQGKQFQLGFSAFLENCQTEVQQQLAQIDHDTDDGLYRSALSVYASSLEATLGRFQIGGKVKYPELMASVKEQVMDAVVDLQASNSNRAITDGFQKTFKTQETHLVQLRGQIERVYRGGQVVVKDEKDELVLVLEKQLRDRISQQREMLLQLHHLESELEASRETDNAEELTAASPVSSGDWKVEMPNMMGS
jgi:hypothetical protein